MLSERVLHEGQNHLFPDVKISGLRNCLREVCILVDTCRESLSRFSSETGEHRQVLQDLDEPFSSSKTTGTSCWELKSKGVTVVLYKLRFKAHKKCDGRYNRFGEILFNSHIETNSL